jgi:hypothetical protein
MEAGARLTIVRQLVREGALPRTFGQLWGGPGTGKTCAACGASLVRPKYEFDCIGADGAVVHLCQPCVVAWDTACREELRAAS